MLEERKATSFVRQYDSLWELTRHLRETARSWSQRQSETAGAYESWDAGLGYQRALDMARDGWPDGVAQISALAALVPTAQLATRSYDVAGDYPDVARALGGDPRCMVRRGKVNAPRPTVTIAVNVCVNGMVDGAQKMNYGAALAGMIDRLESRGTRVELLATDAATGHSGVGYCSISTPWTVKRATDPLDLGAIAYSVAHPAMARRLCFATYERCPSAFEIMGYGSPVKVLEHKHFIGLPEDTLFLAGTHGGPNECRTLEGATKLLELQINVAAGENIATLEVLA